MIPNLLTFFRSIFFLMLLRTFIFQKCCHRHSLFLKSVFNTETVSEISSDFIFLSNFESVSIYHCDHGLYQHCADSFQSSSFSALWVVHFAAAHSVNTKSQLQLWPVQSPEWTGSQHRSSSIDTVRSVHIRTKIYTSSWTIVHWTPSRTTLTIVIVGYVICSAPPSQNSLNTFLLNVKLFHLSFSLG